MSLCRVSSFLCLLLGFLLQIGTVSGVSAREAVALDMRVGYHVDFTRFVIELDRAVDYDVFTLDDPPRLVIDLPRMDWAVPPAESITGRGLVKAARYGHFSAERSRVVLDLKAPVRIIKSLLLPPNERGRLRLFVDMLRRKPGEGAASGDAVAAAARGAGSGQRSEGRQEQEVRVIPPPPAPKQRGRPLIMIDAGHGGVDPGAIAISGAYEKTIALDYARALKAALLKTGLYDVALTRSGDIFLPLRERYRLAEEANADLFISLHANTHPDAKIRGASVFTLSESGADSDAQAAALAIKENAADRLAGNVDRNEVAQILGDLMRRETMNLSKTFANLLVEQLGMSVPLLRNTHRFAGFIVLKSPTVPSVLFEIGYISNRTEEKQIRTDAHRKKVTEAIIRALDSYFSWHEAMQRT